MLSWCYEIVSKICTSSGFYSQGSFNSLENLGLK